MKTKLRHPVRAIREPFGTAGLIVAIVALIAALGGTALAAKHLFTKAQEKQIAKIAKKEAEKFANSNPGAQGAPGAPGKDGTNGTNGTNGANGKSVVLASEEPANCENEEGFAYEIEGSGVENEVCRGPEGSPWTAGGTLPEGATETGTWSTLTEPFPAVNIVGAYEPLSFDLPLVSAPTLVLLDEEESNTPAKNTHKSECPGTTAAPTAAEGHLCVYTEANFGITLSTSFRYTTGAVLVFESSEPLSAWGTWAVTG